MCTTTGATIEKVVTATYIVYTCRTIPTPPSNSSCHRVNAVPNWTMKWIVAMVSIQGNTAYGTQTNINLLGCWCYNPGIWEKGDACRCKRPFINISVINSDLQQPDIRLWSIVSASLKGMNSCSFLDINMQINGQTDSTMKEMSQRSNSIDSALSQGPYVLSCKYCTS